MAIKKIGSLNVQYVCTQFTRTGQALTADRRVGEKPILDILLNDTSKHIGFIISDIYIKPMTSKTVKDGMDIYLLKENAQSFRDILLNEFDKISKNVVLDSAVRIAKDPRHKYDYSGLNIPITNLGNTVKIQEVRAIYHEEKYMLKVRRNSEISQKPYANLEIEKWGSKRLHLGIRNDWTLIKDSSGDGNKIIIAIKWEEYSHLLGCLNNIVSKI